MAIETEFIDFIVPITTIQAKYPGGWDECLKDHRDSLGGAVWYDDYLFRSGAMNGRDITLLINEWTALGFTPYKEFNSSKEWADFCVHEGMSGGTKIPCRWLVKAGPYAVAHIEDPHPEDVKCGPTRIESED
jgi:hypothetical protein